MSRAARARAIAAANKGEEVYVGHYYSGKLTEIDGTEIWVVVSPSREIIYRTEVE